MRRISAIVLAIASLFFQIASASAQTGSISGTVVTNGSQNVDSATIILYSTTNTNTPVTTGPVSNGVYTVGSVPDGSYYVEVVNALTGIGINSQKYVNEVYNNVECGSAYCNFTAGTPVVVTGGAAVPGINFMLSTGGKITGHVSGSPGTLKGQTVVSLGSTDRQHSVATTAQTGIFDYEFDAVPAGNYVLIANNEGGYQTQFYNNQTCVGLACTTITPNQITVVEGQTTQNVDFTLALGGTLSGTITDAATGAPIPFGDVGISDSTGQPLDSEVGGADGTYSGVLGIPTGTYYLTAFASNYSPVLYNNLACFNLTCQPNGGTPVTITAGQNTVINFALPRISPATFPDLSAKLTGIPATTSVKKPTLTIKNSGQLGAPRFTVKFYRSAKSQISAKAKLFKTVVVDRLDANGKKKITFTVKKDPAHPFLIVILDSDSVVYESKETNNTVTKRL